MQNEEDSRRDPEDRAIDENDRSKRKEKMLDKTIADTFPASDPPSSVPDPDKDSFASFRSGSGCFGEHSGGGSRRYNFV
ncbi:MAG TPA: hypothetical protein VKB77_07005 [Terriglobales bacterium]|nr:hypothetical protein [Terriglobales bacterium]